MTLPAHKNRVELLASGDGLRVYNKQQMRELLGGISNSTYYKLLRQRKLLFSRLYPGGPVVHTQQQLEAYLDYLNSAVVNGPSESHAPTGGRRGLSLAARGSAAVRSSG